MIGFLRGRPKVPPFPENEFRAYSAQTLFSFKVDAACRALFHQRAVKESPVPVCQSIVHIQHSESSFDGKACSFDSALISSGMTALLLRREHNRQQHLSRQAPSVGFDDCFDAACRVVDGLDAAGLSADVICSSEDENEFRPDAIGSPFSSRQRIFSVPLAPI